VTGGVPLHNHRASVPTIARLGNNPDPDKARMCEAAPMFPSEPPMLPNGPLAGVSAAAIRDADPLSAAIV